MPLLRPALMNNTEVADDLTIKNRIDSDETFDIYSLEDDKGYLYLFKNLEKNNIINSRHRYKVIYLDTFYGKRPAVIDPEYSRKIQEKIRKELTELVGLDSVAGMKELKELLINEVINPLLNPEKYVKFKLGIPNGILLYGPPGCGKTYIVRKLAEELGYNYVEVKASDIGSSYIHGSVEKISRVFDRARSLSPSILFFDEIEGLVPNRDNLGETGSYKQEEVNQFLAEMNKSGEENVLVVGATNRPNLIDNAVLRSGRFDRRIFISPPDFEARKELFKLYISGRPFSNKINYGKLAELTENYVSSDIELIVEDAARLAVRNDLSEIDEALLESVIRNMIPSVSREDLDYFKNVGDSK